MNTVYIPYLSTFNPYDPTDIPGGVEVDSYYPLLTLIQGNLIDSLNGIDINSIESDYTTALVDIITSSEASQSGLDQLLGGHRTMDDICIDDLVERGWEDNLSGGQRSSEFDDYLRNNDPHYTPGFSPDDMADILSSLDDII